MSPSAGSHLTRCHQPLLLSWCFLLPCLSIALLGCSSNSQCRFDGPMVLSPTLGHGDLDRIIEHGERTLRGSEFLRPGVGRSMPGGVLVIGFDSMRNEALPAYLGLEGSEAVAGRLAARFDPHRLHDDSSVRIMQRDREGLWRWPDELAERAIPNDPDRRAPDLIYAATLTAQERRDAGGSCPLVEYRVSWSMRAHGANHATPMDSMLIRRVVRGTVED